MLNGMRACLFDHRRRARRIGCLECGDGRAAGADVRAICKRGVCTGGALGRSFGEAAASPRLYGPSLRVSVAKLAAAASSTERNGDK